MAEKVAKLGVKREKDFMYYVKDGGVWKVQRKQPGVPKGRPEKVADGGFEMDTNYIYFVDRDGDVARAKRAVGGQKRKKSARKAKGWGAGFNWYLNRNIRIALDYEQTRFEGGAAGGADRPNEKVLFNRFQIAF